MKRQERRGLEGEGSLSNSPWTEEDRPESAQQPVARRQVRSALASTAQDDQLLLEQQVLRHHRSYTTGATELRGHDGEVKQGEQEVLHLRVSVGQTSGAAQHCQTLDSAREFSIRERTGFSAETAKGHGATALDCGSVFVETIRPHRCAHDALVRRRDWRRTSEAASGELRRGPHRPRRRP
jgi:hypothetical protein